MTYQTTAIVLKRRNVGEADRIVTIFSRDRGRYAVVARGVRKLQSKIAGHIEPASEVELYLAEGKTLDVIAGAQTLNRFKGIDRSLDDFAYISKILELIDRLLPELQAAPEVYDLSQEALSLVDSGRPARVVCLWFELRLLALLGLQPQLAQCAECRQSFEIGEGVQILRSGGVTHLACARADGLALGAAEFKLLRLIFSANSRLIFAVKDLAGFLPALEEASKQLRLYLGEQRLVSDRFIESV